MNYHEFIETIDQKDPPDLSPLLTALWHDKNDDWENAHGIAQEVNSEDGYWVHAYLHRKEGDIWNADYWYSRAGKKRPNVDLDAEWEAIVMALLS
ncbi:MAG: hypothetical protein RJQ09_03015 [Cyclobacteriaceae bacterium]